MTSTELGKIMKNVRENLLDLNQIQLGEALGVKQSVISRFERGDGGTIQFLLSFVEFLNKKGYQGHMLLNEPFDLHFLKKGDAGNKKEFTIELLKETQQNFNENMNRAIGQLDLL